MNLFVYSDESGVFDKYHYQFFVFAGLIIPHTANKEMWARKYSSAEKSINSDNKYGDKELKASKISVKDKNKLFRSLNQCYKFAVIVDQSKLLDELFASKKDKQRYLDYELHEILEQEFILGTFNYDYSRYYPPILPNANEVEVHFCNSATNLLIRASDICANKVYFCAVNDKLDGLDSAMNLFVMRMPEVEMQEVYDPKNESTEN